MTRSWEFLVGMLVAAITLVLPSSVADVYAIHSIPITPHFFDFDNDGVPEASDSGVLFNKRGAEWTTAATSRANDAMIAWSSQTDFNPAISSSPQVQDIWVDGTAPVNVSGSHCPPDFNSWTELGFGNPADVYAVNCLYRGTLRQGGPNPLYGYYRLQDSNIFLNSNNVIFNWGTTQGLKASARGVLTHEIGHAALLEDEYDAGCGSPMITMCGAFSDSEAFGLYTLTSDDISAANGVYLP